MQLPNWMLENSTIESQGTGKLSKSTSYVDKTLNGISELMESTFFSEKYASKNGILQKIDPRIKVLSIFSVLIMVVILKQIVPILIVYGLLLGIVVWSKIDLGFFIKRVWIFIPIFAGIIAFPSIFNIFSPGTALITLVKYDHTDSVLGLEF